MRPATRWTLLALALILVIGTVAVGVLLTIGDSPAEQAEPTPAPTPPAPAPPPAPEPPFTRIDDSSLTLPQRVSLAESTVYLRPDAQYVVRYRLSTVKPEDAPGIGMYLNVGLACADQDGTGLGSIGGTENLLPGQESEFENHLIVEPSDAAVMTCSITADAPNDDVAAAGTTVQLNAEWTVTEVTGTAVTASKDDLPTVINAGADASALTADVPLARGRDDAAEALLTAHLTTCTGEAGSRENGRSWCTPPGIDEAGSTVTVTVRAQVVDERGQTCATLREESQTLTITTWRHHELVPSSLPLTIPTDLCGGTLRVTVEVANDGPAAVVMHQANSSLSVETEDAG